MDEKINEKINEYLCKEARRFLFEGTDVLKEYDEYDQKYSCIIL